MLLACVSDVAAKPAAQESGAIEKKETCFRILFSLLIHPAKSAFKKSLSLLIPDQSFI